ncbi:hypothetical protein C8F04DRAFT_1388754 [Mycena alexandri]|uniref:Uncharacterized protein n=1 Tax=Mycena alexandri TaxID=1745969 RepID=A0AAD6THU6_9AGAR|nr:hypothetical protein C8F04DRAFT_1388754 [Mycena alexandri]
MPAGFHPQEEPSVGPDEGLAMQEFTPTRRRGGVCARGYPSEGFCVHVFAQGAATFVTTLPTMLPRTCARLDIMDTDPETQRSTDKGKDAERERPERDWICPCTPPSHLLPTVPSSSHSVFVSNAVQCCMCAMCGAAVRAAHVGTV